jgi:hypothetical protein
MEGKGSLLHQSVQKHIYDLLPEGEAIIEHRLPGHIADLVWIPEKIIFEIQVSPISIDTAVARTNDYKKLGFQLVWILHQKNFNGSYLSLAELYLRKIPHCYFTNVSIGGHGYIYDQIESIKNNKRVQRGPPIILDLKNILSKKRRKKGFFFNHIISVLTKSLWACYTSLKNNQVRQNHGSRQKRREKKG